MKALLGALFLILPIAASAETVVPIESVGSFVNIRMSPKPDTEIVGRLNKGDELVYVQTVDGWHEVRLPGGGSGFVHGDWANIIADIVQPDEPAVVEEPTAVAEEPAAVVAASEDVAEEPAVVAEEPEVVAEQSEVVVETESPPADEVPPTVTELADEAAVIAAVPLEGAKHPSTLKGTRNFLVRFKDEAAGGNSQVFDDGNFVGIGTTAPKQRLEVNGSIQIHEQNSSVAGLMITQSSGETGYVLHNRASTLTIGAGSLDRITIDRDGNVGFGVDRPTHPIEMASGAYVSSGGVWTNSSSRARKRDIENLGAVDAQQALDGLQAVRFRYKNDPRESYVGFIAEDVPELVAMQGRDSLSAMDIVAVLTRVVQDQQHRIAELEARLEHIE